MIIFQSFLLISLQHVMDQDTNQQTGRPGLIYGTVGQNVTLQCKLEEIPLEKLMVSWTFENQSIKVHLYRNEGDDEDSQHSDYKKRTSVFPDQFKHGNFSLELANVTKKDEGTYTWAVHNKDGLKKSGNITLHVVDKNGSPLIGTSGKYL
ncbi:PREDICTED: CD276 antigen-like [Poecilia mexicana]|uniref:CD276 antigen-like n=1 Tax=Poecilia mexicana TaxID=48701 RepID=UPI00072E951F|nr:PREDICTED: CD276 antigen-like [Poecilia mexicana]